MIDRLDFASPLGVAASLPMCFRGKAHLPTVPLAAQASTQTHGEQRAGAASSSASA
jgi:hypothetical protein